MKKRQQVLEAVLDANMPKAEYDIFSEEVNARRNRLLKSIEQFCFEGFKDEYTSEFVNKISKLEVLPQEQYAQVPFRMEEYDQKSTIASSGCAILVAKFLEHVFDCEHSFSVEELAKMTVSKGYRGYRKKEDGSWTPVGCKHVFFDRFIPSVYGVKAERVDSVQVLFQSLKENKIPVLLVSNKIYKEDSTNTDSHFIVLLGYNKDKLVVWDSEVAGAIEVPYARVIPAIRVVWVFTADNDNKQ